MMSLCNSSLFIAASSIFTLVVITCLFTMICVCCIFYARIRGFDVKLCTWGKLLRIIFIISSLIAVGCYLLWTWEPCVIDNHANGDKIITTTEPVWLLCYGMQNITLSILFYMTIVHVFDGTICNLQMYTNILKSCIQSVQLVL